MGSGLRKDAAQLRQMCREDILFAFNTFYWLYQGDTGMIVPFITYPIQDTAILEVNAAIGAHDIAVVKSRNQGMSFIGCYVPTYRFQFFDMQSFLFVSYREAAVDAPGNPGCLFWKINWNLEHQPSWITGRWKKTFLHFESGETGSVMDGTATTETIATGDRRMAVIPDEMGKWPERFQARMMYETQAVTKCRLFISTPNGPNNTYAKVAHDPKKRRIYLHWSQHPVQNEGLYRLDKAGKVEVLDKKWHKANPGYDFRSTAGFFKGLRSPYYDGECDRVPPGMEHLIHQELDMSFNVDDFTFFNVETLDALEEKHGREPISVGDVEYEVDTGEFLGYTAQDNGHLRLWMALDEDGNPPTDREYVIGCDVSMGTGASPSTVTIGDCLTGEKVGEFANNRLRPDQFGTFLVALGQWFAGKRGSALLIVEATGPGAGTLGRIVDLGYRHLYYRTREGTLSRKQSDTPGWYSTGSTKFQLFTEFRRAWYRGEYLIPSDVSYTEAMQYVHVGNEKVEHSAALVTENVADAKSAHGDHTIADALCWWAMRRHKAVVEMAKKELPAECGQRRYDERMALLTQNGSWFTQSWRQTTL